MFDSINYWDHRYRDGGNSGKGSYGQNAEFKANFINDFCKKKKIRTAIEIGCGDGNNLALYKFEEYVGLDVSAEAVEMCRMKFKEDENKLFGVYVGDEERQHDISLCLDVTYHIFPREKREKTINHGILLGRKYALFYSFLNPTGHAKHINDYNFIEYIEQLSKELGFSYYIAEETPPDSQSRFVFIKK